MTLPWGNIGKLAIYYSHFLDEPIDTQEKEEAWAGLISLLDSLEEVDYPEEINSFINERYGQIDFEKSKENSSRVIESILRDKKESKIIKKLENKSMEGNNEMIQKFMIENFSPIFEDIKQYLCVLSRKFKKFNEILSS